MRNEHVLNDQGMLDDHSIERNEKLRPVKAYQYLLGCLVCLLGGGFFTYGVIFFKPKLAYGACAALFIANAIRQLQYFLHKLRK